MSLGEMQISFLLFFAPKFHLISYLELYSEKVDKDEVSYNKAIHNISSRITHIHSKHQKSYLGPLVVL
jgi:hypothetical protein